jgi:hypothetical protein
MMEKNEYTAIVAAWIENLAKALGVNLALDEDGFCFFQMGESTVIGLEVSQEFPLVYIYSPILVLPQDDKEMVTLMMIRALELNAFQAITRGGAIAIAPGGGPLLYCYSTP